MSAYSISPAHLHELMTAARVLVGSNSNVDRELEAERCRDSLALGQYDRAGLFVSRDTGGRITGAVLMQAMPGALGVAWPARGESESIQDALVRAASDWLRGRGVKVCQAFASFEESADMASLERNGFERITQLAFFQREVDAAFGWGTALPVAARCYPCPDLASPEQAGVLLETHVGSQDCPELNGTRTPEEILAGFPPGKPERCSWWNAIEVEDRPVGVLLLERDAEPSALEISYLGLIPSARGRGLGATALAFANAIAGRAGYRSVSASVDGRNEPALRLYRKHGFVETGRRQVYLARW